MRPGPAGGRGEWNRFPAYALWGLMRYPLARQDAAFDDGIRYSYTMLQRYSLPAGGWSQSRKDGPLWLPVTMVAVHALDRLALYTSNDAFNKVRQLTNRARDHVTSEGRKHNRHQMYWMQAPTGEPCPGTTSLASLILARGSREHRDAARAGINWLASNPGEWAQRIHHDNQVDSRVWRILSFSLGLRALLHPCAPHDVTDPAVTSVVQHIATLWNEEQHGWADLPGFEASTSGSYAVVSAIHTLKKAWPFDPFRALGVRAKRGHGRGHGPPRANRILYIIASERAIRVDDRFGDIEVQTRIRGDSQWAFLEELATRHESAEKRGCTDLDEMTLGLEEFARACKGGTGAQLPSAIKTIDRLQDKLAAEAREQRKPDFLKLIEDHVPPGTTEQRYALEEIEVKFVDEFPEPPQTSSNGVRQTVRR
jgi:hypothetical protein